MKLILQAIKSLLRSLQNSIRATQKAAADAETKAEEAKATAEEALASTPDWDQNDETAPDYIQNRTHYEEVLPEYVVFDAEMESNTKADVPLRHEIPAGVTVAAYKDGQWINNATAEQYNDGIVRADFAPGLYVRFYNSELKATVSNYEFMSVCDVKIVVTDLPVELKTLDDKYIPDTIARKTDIPDVPTIPDKLPNPNALTFSGAVTGSYDGSAPKEIKIPEIKEYTLPAASETALGGVKASAKTEDMTQPVGIGEDGFLFTAPGGSGGDGKTGGELVGTWSLEEEVSVFTVTLDEPISDGWLLEIAFVGTASNTAKKEPVLHLNDTPMAYYRNYLYESNMVTLTQMMLLPTINLLLDMESFLYATYNGNPNDSFYAGSRMKTGAVTIKSLLPNKKRLDLSKIEMRVSGGVFGVGTAIRIYKINGI